MKLTKKTGFTAVGSPYNYSVTGTVGTCSATRSVQVTVNPLPVTNPISGPAQVCINDTSSYFTVSPSGGNYTWTISGGTILSGQGTDSIRIQWSAVGLGTIDVVDTNAFGCALAGLCYAELSSSIPISVIAYTYTYAT